MEDRFQNMTTKAAPMVYARVLRALAAAGEKAERLQGLHPEVVAESLNHEFHRLGITIDVEEVRLRKSALEIAEVITERIAA